MPLHARFDDDIAVLSNVGLSMNDPRYMDAGHGVKGLLDEGIRTFVVELRASARPGRRHAGIALSD